MPPATNDDEKDCTSKVRGDSESDSGDKDDLLKADEKMSSKTSNSLSVGDGSAADPADATRRSLRRAPHRHMSPSPVGRGRHRTSSMSQLTSVRTTSVPDPIIRTPNRTIYLQGRPPWYDSSGQQAESCFVGICGGSASGKTTVAKAIIEALDMPWVTLLSMDSFYKNLTAEDREKAGRNDYNFDHPDAFDFELMIDTLMKLKEGRKVDVPVYNFVTHAREEKPKTMYGANVVIFEGIMAFYNPRVLELLDVKVFVDTDSDIRLARRLERDIAQRGRDLVGVLSQYGRFVKPAYDLYIAPSRVHADIIVPRGGENRVAITLIVQNVQSQMQARGFKVREKLVDSHAGQPLPATQLRILPETPQVRGMHTYIRARDTTRDEFIFYSQRLMRLLMEYALTFLPHREVTVETATGMSYKGMALAAPNICGISIVRAGETMEDALTDVLKDVRIGKILIQTNMETGEPELYYLRLPDDIKNYHVFVMDATVATGAAAMMAVRVLLDHDVPEENIFLLSLVMARIGVQTIAYAFPKVKIVTTAVDEGVNDKFYVVPGIGNFGDRYYGTEPGCCDE